MVCFRNVNTQFRFISGNVTCYLIVNYQRLSGSHAYSVDDFVYIPFKFKEKPENIHLLVFVWTLVSYLLYILR